MLGVSLETLQYLANRYGLSPVVNDRGEFYYEEDKLRALLETAESTYRKFTENKATIGQKKSFFQNHEKSSDSPASKNGSPVRETKWQLFVKFAYLRPGKRAIVLGVITLALLFSLGYAQMSLLKLKAQKANDTFNTLEETSSKVLGAATSKLKLTGNILFSLPLVSKENVAIGKELEVTGKSFFKDDITAPNIVYGITAGGGITITGDAQNPVISAVQGGVTSLQGTTGDLSLIAGSDISISGLTISNTSTLSTVVSRGDCTGCITDAAVVNTLTIDSGGQVAAGAIKGTLTTSVGGTGLSTYATGDLIYASATDTLDSLPIGAAGQFLTVDNGLPAWAFVSSFAVANVKQNNVIVSSQTNTLNFANSDFSLNESPAGQVNIQLSAVPPSITGVQNNFAVGGSTLTFAAAGTVSSTGANALTIDSGTTGLVNLGTGNNAKTINIATGTAGNTVNIATDNTAADTINIGSALDTNNLNSGLIYVPNGRVGIRALPNDIDADTNPFALEVAGSIGPNVDGVYDLGSPSLRYRNLYITGATTSNGDITIANTSPKIYFIDTDVGQNQYLVNVDTSQFTLKNNTTGATALFVDSNGDVSLAGGSSSTGCTIADATGNLVCAGSITTTNTSGTVGFFSRNNGASTISPATAGDTISTSGNILTTGTGTITAAGLLTASNGLTVTAGGINVNSTGITNAGDILGAGAISASAALTFTGAGTNITTVSNADLTIGANGSGQLVISSNVLLGTLPAAGVSATTLCRDNTTHQITQCPANASNVSLQDAYNAGNTIQTSDNRDIAFTLTDTATDSKFTLTNQGTATAFTINDTNAAVNTLLSIQSNGTPTLTIDENGTLSTSGNISTTGTGTVTSAGLLTASNGLTVSAGGISANGGINNNNGGITNAGDILGAGAISASAALTFTGSGTNITTV